MRLHLPRASPLRKRSAGTSTDARLLHAPCDGCVAGSNAWAVSGTRTASGKPLLSNDMHLSLSVPELWYEADLEAAKPAPQADFHAAGVTLPGTPFIIAGHNDHVAWGFTNLGADVQDLYVSTPAAPCMEPSTRPPAGDGVLSATRPKSSRCAASVDVTPDVPSLATATPTSPLSATSFPAERRSLSCAGPSMTLPTSAHRSSRLTQPATGADASCLRRLGRSRAKPDLRRRSGHIGYHALGRIPYAEMLIIPVRFRPFRPTSPRPMR